jgi:hypothetical protein
MRARWFRPRWNTLVENPPSKLSFSWGTAHNVFVACQWNGTRHATLDEKMDLGWVQKFAFAASRNFEVNARSLPVLVHPCQCKKLSGLPMCQILLQIDHYWSSCFGFGLEYQQLQTFRPLFCKLEAAIMFTLAVTTPAHNKTGLFESLDTVRYQRIVDPNHRIWPYHTWMIVKIMSETCRYDRILIVF